MMSKSFAAGCLVVSATVLSACAGGSTEHEGHTATSTAAPPSVQVSLPPAPAQTGEKQVRFDPCARVGDDLVSRAGFDPATRERAVSESVSSLFTEIGCQFWREELVAGEKFPTGALTVTSTDLTLDDIRNNPGHSIFSTDPVNGREALLYRTPQSPGSCSAAMKSADGMFRVGLLVHPGPVAAPPACDQIRQLAEIFSASLGTS
ncbi:DUF3558 domain-containing protein [Nocardia brasiliensis]|uniref:DUF3558 domain-containing protein n=1 Tax=Nocardia brasiliensis TaxID=37326 RepID=UPI001895C2BA|nr:DUF3558 domain-containing protein [Nocardia brasiliensis]MBF6127826.1 DUF3558 domain-containing protein [Nocardia brasiliensis]